MGVLRVLSEGAWVDVPTALLGFQQGPRGATGLTGIQGSNEVFVGPNDPGVGAGYKIWVDSDDSTMPTAFPASMPRGYIGHKLATASSWTNATATNSALTVTTGAAPSISFTAVAQRYYLARWYAPLQSSVAGDVWETTIAVTGLSDENAPLRIQTANTTDRTGWMERLFQTSGAVTASVLARRASGTGTLSLAGVSASDPMAFWIEDIGGY